MLNIPSGVLDIIRTKNNILIAGFGGGFDVFAGLPLYYTLEKLGKTPVLANYSFTDFDNIKLSTGAEIINENLIGANANFDIDLEYYPEGYLSKWFKAGPQKDVTIWCMKKTGTIPLKENYKILIEKFNIDLIILIDGGVDSVNTGMETGHGTIMEETVNISALSEIEGVKKIVMCVGFGTEVEEKVCHYNVLMNMANIVKNDGFYGTCSLVKNLNSYRYYKSACEFVFNQPIHKTSHIQRRIIPAVEGEFGDFHATDEDLNTEIFISPLMSICWFFNFEALFIYNKLLSYVSDTHTFYEVVQNTMPHINAAKHNIPYNVIPY